DLPDRVSALQEEVRELKRQLNKQSTQSAAGLVDTLVKDAAKVGDVSIVTAVVDATDADGIRALIDQIRRKASPVAVLLGSVHEEKIILIAGLSQELVDKKLSASDWVKATAKVVGGGGGGRPDLAQAGGKDPTKLNEAIQQAATWFTQKLG
ncbi:MAG: alanine--tRNA ligase, partial [Planctomycetaceae bacterium]|nr:alanine--tRNA ligase [Planctomycetaceae bacterium]